jgi:CRISPR-associated exonuclease Cas4
MPNGYGSTARMNDANPIAISALQHYAYCPRQCALIHVEQVFDDNVYTARGQAVHKLVDTPGYEIKAGVKVERALPLWSDRLGLIGKADVVEFHPGGAVFPVEFKHGRKREKIHDDIQLAAQAMCLEEMLSVTILRGAIYHASSHRRREVEITPELRHAVEATVNAVRQMMDQRVLPPPVNDERCRACSLIDACQPAALADVTRLKRMYDELLTPDS